MYGRILRFVRVVCGKHNTSTEIAMVEWFATPQYPEGDPLVVSVNMNEDPPVNLDPFVLLDYIDPTPVMYEIVSRDNTVFMMRTRGIDSR